jgi:hypothetical protein
LNRRTVAKAFAAIGVFGVLVSMAAVAWPAPGAQAAINSAINFQGKLANADGTNIPNGTYNLEFKLYTGGAGCVSGGSSPCGGSLQWTEDWLRNSSQGVTVTDGIFQVNLGSITSLPAIFDNNTIWMSINLGNTNATCTPFSSCSGDGEMLPFVRFTASPYAFNSDALQGLHAADFAQLSPGSAQSGFLNVNGNVTSGATVAAATSLQAPLVDSSAALNVGTSSASSVTVGRAMSTTNLTLQGSDSTSWSATSASGATTVSFVSPTGTNSIRFQNAGGDVCTTVASTCNTTYQAAGSYLIKNTGTDTSSFAVTATNYLYGFTNSSSAVASGVLKLDNGTNIGNGLYVTTSGNPGSGSALIVANSTAGSPSGNLLDLQVSGTSQLAVDSSGNLTQNGGSGTTDTVNDQRISAAANFTGTVTAATSLLAPLLDTASSGILSLGTLSATVIDLNQNTIVASGKSLTANGNVTVGTTGSTTLFKNNGATQNVVCAYSGVSGTITLTTGGKTVNDCTAFTITDTGATTISTIASPTAGAGSIVYINNLPASTNSVTILGASLPVGDTEMLVFDGTTWTTGAGASAAVVKLQDAYNNSAGAAPSILETATNKAITVQSAIASGMSAGQELFGVRDAHSSDTLGNSILTVSSYGLGINVGGTAQNPTLQSGIDLQFGGAADKVIAVIDQATAATNGAALTVRAAAGNTSGTGGNLVLVAGAGGTSGIGGAASLKGGAAGGGYTNGGAVTVQGGAGTGSGIGGAATLAGGVASSTGAGGLVVISAANGGSSAANTVGPGGNITLQAGSAAGSNNNNGGSISLSGGNATGTGTGGSITLSAGTTTGTPGVVSIGTPVFTSVSETFTQTTNNQGFTKITDPTLLTNLNTYGTIVMNVAGAFTGATVTMPSPTNAIAGRVVYVSADSGSVAFTLAATGMSSVNMSPGNTATLVWNGTSWSGTTTASSLQQVYNNTSTAPASIITTSTTKNILFQAGVGDDNANVFQVGNSSAAPVIAIDTTNTATGLNVASNGGVETGGTPPSGWSLYTGSGGTSIVQNTNPANLASGVGSVDVSITGAGTGGANNALSSTALASSRLYAVSFNIKSSSGTPTIAVQYYKDATPTLDATCSVPTNGTVNSTSFFKYTCFFTTSASGQTTGNFLRISKTDASTIADIYIDNLAVVAQNTTGTKNTGSLRVGGPLSQGLTLLTLDTFAAVPFTGTVNQDLYGSMYYDTTLGRIQCYEIDGWGSCGAAPDSNLILSPEYAGAVLSPITYNGETVNAHIGTMTASICSNSKGIQPSYGSICASGEEYNYYQWTTSQVTSQSYSIFVKYQLPPTFGGFADANTIKMVGRVSNTTDAAVYYTVYRGSTECGGTGSRTLVTTPSANTWYQTNLASDETACSFAPNDIVTFEIDMYSKNNAYAYASQINFTMKGK